MTYPHEITQKISNNGQNNPTGNMNNGQVLRSDKSTLVGCIHQYQLPVGANIPEIPKYDRMGDLDDHIENYN